MTYTYKDVYKITLPVLFSLIMQNIIGMTDTAFLGRVGEVELGASALGSVYYLALFMIGFGFCNGTQILVARRHGEKNSAKIGTIVSSSFIAVVVLGLFFLVVSQLFTAPLLGCMVKSPKVLDATVDYMNLRVYGLPFVFVVLVFRSFFVGVTHTRILALNSGLMVVCNVFLNYVLIFGELGFPKMGIGGAALASSLSEAIAALGFVVYSIFKVDFKKYNFLLTKLWDYAIFCQVLSLSIWTMLQMFISIIVWMFFFIAVEHLGERSLAVVNLIRNLSALCFMLINAFSVTASSLISNLIGANNREGVWRLSWQMVFQASWLVIPFLILLVIFSEQVLGLYTNQQELIEMAQGTLGVMVIGCLLQLPARIFHSVVSGTGNTAIAMWVESAALLVYTVAVWYFAMVLNGSVPLCWSTEIIYQVVILAGAVPYIRWGNWRAKEI